LCIRNITFEPLPIVDGVKLINAAGGRAVVAHIPTLGPDWLDTFATKLADLKEAGLWGIEGFSSEVNSDNHGAIEKIAQSLKLVVTGGSDNHGSLKVCAPCMQCFLVNWCVDWCPDWTRLTRSWEMCIGLARLSMRNYWLGFTLALTYRANCYEENCQIVIDCNMWCRNKGSVM
jgi:hypothetical protein